MSELFLEIAEDIRRERLDNVWRKIGRVAVWGSIAIVVATTLYVVWSDYTQSQAEEKTTKLLLGIERIDAQNYKGAISALSPLTDDSSSPYYLLAMLRKAQAQEGNSDVDGAKKTYGILARHNSELAVLAQLKSDAKNVKTEASPSSPFYHTVAEFNAWQLLGSGKNSEAAEIFASLAQDDKAPRSLAERASEALRIITPEKLAEKSKSQGVNNE